jgi:hypothetical protein
VTSDVVPCFWYRAGFAAKALADAGEIEFVELKEPLRVRYALRRKGPQQAIGLVEAPRNVDRVIFVRGVFPERLHQVVHFLRADYDIKCLVDFDDAYDRLPGQLLNLYKINPAVNPSYNWRHAIDAARIANGVTISTPALARYRTDATLLRNCIPQRYLVLGRAANRDGTHVGWSGVIAGHPGDLRVCGAGIAEAIRASGATFVNIGDGIGIQKELGLEQEPEITGIVSFEDYPKHIAKLDVGIAPLALNSYVQHKSALKPLEYLSMGAQYVASAGVSEYELLQAELELWCAQNGAPVPGALARPRARDWRRRLLGALGRAQDASQRQELAEVARRFIEERYLVEKNAWRWLEAWSVG